MDHRVAKFIVVVVVALEVAVVMGLVDVIGADVFNMAQRSEWPLKSSAPFKFCSERRLFSNEG